MEAGNVRSRHMKWMDKFCAGICMERADLVFVVDNSATISAKKYRQLLEFLVKVVAQLDVDSGKIRVAAITYSDQPSISFSLSTYSTRLDVARAISRLPYSGYETDTAAALRMLRNATFRYVTVAI